MAITYSIAEILDPTGKSTGLYQGVRKSNEPGEPPLLYCIHEHRTQEDARKCRDFPSDGGGRSK